MTDNRSDNKVSPIEAELKQNIKPGQPLAYGDFALMLRAIFLEARQGKKLDSVDHVAVIIVVFAGIAMLADSIAMYTDKLHHKEWGPTATMGIGLLAAWLGLGILMRRGSPILLLAGSFVIAFFLMGVTILCTNVVFNIAGSMFH